MKRWSRLLPVFVALIACDDGTFNSDSIDHIDRKLDLTRNDYRNMYDLEHDKDGKLLPSKNQLAAPPVPDIAPLLAAPRPPKIGNAQLVSIAVTDDVPLKDVLVELARLADVDIEIDSGIIGGVNFRAKDKPFNEVIERIATLAGLRYSIKNGVLRVERDVPYVVNYSVDFLNMTRNSSSNIFTNSSGGGAGGGGGSGGGGGGSSGGGGGSSGGGGGGGGGGSGGGGGGSSLGSGSSSSIESSVSDDFWLALQSGVVAILSTQPINMTSEGANQLLAQQQSGGGALAGGALAGGAAAGGAAAAGGVAAGGAGAAGGGAGGAAGSMSTIVAPGYYMNINRQAGIIAVSASQHQHEIIKKYIEEIKRSASAQVLIEAKIIEVSLNDEFRSGIDWRFLNGKFTGSGAFNVNIPATAGANVASFTLGDSESDLSAAVDLIEVFGTSRTLSSPRLHAINNQPAVLTFTRNEVFFEIEYEQGQTVSTGNVAQTQSPTITSTRQTLPIGIILNILPSIDVDHNEVTLNVRPTLTRRVGQVEDPGAALAAALNRVSLGTDFPPNLIPVVEVRELDSILKVNSGDVMVIGGLMQQGSDNTDRGLPWFADLPVVGNAFKSVEKTNQNSELIIMIRATIVSPQGSYSATDKQIYEKFNRDPRPLAF
ncbi:MAG: hypothetical protein K2Q12_00040 [Rickettsiales bacterium]|nr:hypothetical protein [Rickettsiales bacterium]